MSLETFVLDIVFIYLLLMLQKLLISFFCFRYSDFKLIFGCTDAKLTTNVTLEICKTVEPLHMVCYFVTKNTVSKALQDNTYFQVFILINFDHVYHQFVTVGINNNNNNYTCNKLLSSYFSSCCTRRCLHFYLIKCFHKTIKFLFTQLLVIRYSTH